MGVCPCRSKDQQGSEKVEKAFKEQEERNDIKSQSKRSSIVSEKKFGNQKGGAVHLSLYSDIVESEYDEVQSDGDFPIEQNINDSKKD